MSHRNLKPTGTCSFWVLENVVVPVLVKRLVSESFDFDCGLVRESGRGKIVVLYCYSGRSAWQYAN